jgi:hypothetical protein
MDFQKENSDIRIHEGPLGAVDEEDVAGMKVSDEQQI